MERVPVSLENRLFVSCGFIYPMTCVDSFCSMGESGACLPGAENTRQVPGQEAGSFHQGLSR